MTLKGIRRRSLKRQGFLPWEYNGIPIVVKGRVKVVGLKDRPISKHPWVKDMRRERAREYRGMRQIAYEQNWSKARFIREWRSRVRSIYKINGWELADGRPDVWQMYQDYRAEAIRRGEWEETPRYRKKGSHRRKVETETGLVRIDKGRIRDQRARYREKQRGY